MIIYGKLMAAQFLSLLAFNIEKPLPLGPTGLLRTHR